MSWSHAVIATSYSIRHIPLTSSVSCSLSFVDGSHDVLTDRLLICLRTSDMHAELNGQRAAAQRHAIPTCCPQLEASKSAKYRKEKLQSSVHSTARLYGTLCFIMRTFSICSGDSYMPVNSALYDRFGDGKQILWTLLIEFSSSATKGPGKLVSKISPYSCKSRYAPRHRSLFMSPALPIRFVHGSSVRV